MNPFNFPDGTQIDSFQFDEANQTITAIKRISSKQVYASNPPQSAPDKVWKEVYGVKDGKLCLLETKEGKHIPRSINNERIVFDEEPVR
jgi:hypothetical protein